MAASNTIFAPGAAVVPLVWVYVAFGPSVFILSVIFYYSIQGNNKYLFPLDDISNYARNIDKLFDK